MHELHTRRRIEFADTDLAGIVHFARFFVFMETAEHELLAALGVSPRFEQEGAWFGWPRVSASCDYLAPARFGDLLDIHLKLARKGRTSLTWACEISRGGEPIARGQVTAAFCRLDGPEGPRAVPIPDSLADRLAEEPAVSFGPLAPPLDPRAGKP
jgi:acyl-CoA thioester hydrolase